MKKIIEVTLNPANIQDPDMLRSEAARLLGCSTNDISALRLLKRSLDARSRTPVYKCTVGVYINELPEADLPLEEYRPVRTDAKTVHIAGFGPAGMFAALRLIELGYKPVIFERGKRVRERRRDIKALMQEHLVNENSNYCFGEGGAGTFSDGKLYTRSNKRGDVGKILRVLHAHGAAADIVVDAHPHIGSNKLPKIVEAIRETIITCGGEINFNTAVTDLHIKEGKLHAIQLSNGNEIASSALILAVGHSARDVFRLLKKRNVFIEPKPFAVGVRIEHPQAYINKVQYHSPEVMPYLPPAAYSVACQTRGKGVFSFCMCPGGMIVPAATAKDEIVLNGMSVSKRNSAYANSGLVATIGPSDWDAAYGNDPLAGMYYQMAIEQRAFALTGSQKAPAQRATDFLGHRISAALPPSSYFPGIQSLNLEEVLPPEIIAALRSGLVIINKKMKGFVSDDALLLAPETRTSSPVRIPRDRSTGMHIGVAGLIPAGEGAGYAGGIVSAAIDGEACAEAAARYF
jgi:uncharacterized FAD-dependent dehydrogenase